MKVAFISDIHGNLEALSKVLEDIDNRNIDLIMCNGDIVGYYPNPSECIKLVRKHCENVILGNHDETITSKDFKKQIAWFNHIAVEALIWTREALLQPNAVDNFHYLESLTPQKSIQIGEAKILLAHGTPEEKWEYFLKDPFIGDFSPNQYVRLRKWLKKWDLVVVGHTHQPFMYKFRKKIVLNPGSVGQPRDGIPKASYAVVNISESGINPEIIRLDFDIKKTCDSLLAANLHDYLCQRLFLGR